MLILLICGLIPKQLNIGIPNDGCLHTHYVKTYDIRMGDSVSLSVKPSMMTASNKLRQYPVAARQCYFSDERRLTYFNHYTQKNCENDCEIKNIIKHCGCLPIYFEGKENYTISVWNIA
jgi:Amiloride-sensitive sodium channel